jgi:hypothetical protein
MSRSMSTSPLLAFPYQSVDPKSPANGYVPVPYSCSLRFIFMYFSPASRMILQFIASSFSKVRGSSSMGVILPFVGLVKFAQFLAPKGCYFHVDFGD